MTKLAENVSNLSKWDTNDKSLLTKLFLGPLRRASGQQVYLYPFILENPVFETIFSLSRRFSSEIVLKVIANTELSVLQLSNMAYKAHVQ